MKTFNSWMERVDSRLVSLIGLSYLDLPDMPWRSWYDSSLSVGEAVEACLVETDIDEGPMSYDFTEYDTYM